MDGFRSDQEHEEAAGEGVKETEDFSCSWSSHPHVQAHHRRSKRSPNSPYKFLVLLNVNYASDRDSNVSRDCVLHPAKKDQKASPLSTRAYRTRSPLHDRFAYSSNKSTSLNQRASLEKDIELLQSRLQQEKSMRIMLERAMGRASSTLSPGHRHFAPQTKELIAEIELLEEEVANREQHVLSLYRSIFDHCVSRPPSGQSSGKPSPAHPKHTSRKHPSIISSAFCSSKKFPLRPFQALVSTNNSGKRISRSIDPSQFCGKNDILFDKTCSHPVKAHEKVQGIEKTSVLRTLKDHLYQCPSKLSEEMVRCMAAVYCWLQTATTSLNSEQNRSPLLSRSSTNVVLPRRGIGDNYQDFSCTSNVEISWISADKNQFSRASYAISNYRALVEQLERVTVSRMECNAQIAFWINVYNALVMHAYLAYGIPHGSLRRLALFHKLKVHTASNVKEELEVAKREFLQANVVVKKSKKVFLPKLLERFAKEASISSDDLLNWVIENVDKRLQHSIQKCVDGGNKSKKKPSQVIEWLPYSSRFRYIFSKDLTEKL
ncbi:hypothetical protein PTKIN_Ptkin04bG0210400 [Pterospermum kingtungense]